MSEINTRGKALVLEYKLDASAEKVWRAISIPAFREVWLPSDALADSQPVSFNKGSEIIYRMQGKAPYFIESLVSFQITPDAEGGSILKIIHQPTQTISEFVPSISINDDSDYFMLAA